MYGTLIMIALLLSFFGFYYAYAHTTIEVEPYEIEVGWQTEPPVVGFRNAFTFEISESGETEGVSKGVLNAFKNLEAIAKFGGVTKTLEINSDPRPGHYFSPVIPTRTGTIMIELKGDINGVPVNEVIQIEDVESTAVLDFPQTSGSSSDQDVAVLKSALSSMQRDISELKSKVGGIDTSDRKFSVVTAYNFAVFGLSLGAAGVILAIIAMIKRK